MPIYTRTAVATCDTCDTNHPTGAIDADEMDFVLKVTDWHMEHGDDGAIITCPTCWKEQHDDSWYILGHRYSIKDTWEQFDRYIYEPQNQIVQREGNWAIIKCPSKYLAEYQQGRLHSGMMGSYGGPHPALDQAQVELRQKLKEDAEYTR